MKNERIMADSFMVKKWKLRIYRIRQTGTATVLWLSRDDALIYLQELQAGKLQADQGR